ncbi:MAG: hypothetical protein O2955_07300 [Planctomycetota bacterium]|nr:hypothetical protein [Planctomycetota bacterium]MDA1212304.1 hypothetical protein [Planctomycetota bacterium]
MSLSETPWPGIVLCGLVALFCLLAYGSTQRRNVLYIALASVAFAPLFVLWDELVETESEIIGAAVVDMANDFRHGDVDGVLAWIDPHELKLKGVVYAAAELVDVTSDIRITAMDVKLIEGTNDATSDFRANADLNVKGFGNVGRQPTRWLLTWRKENDQWRIIGIDRKNPLTGDPIRIFDKSP